jgi:tetratricopeptide (TPR) repeat protein
MIERFKRKVAGGLAVVAFALLLAPAGAQAQDMGRFRVLIPDLFPMEGSDDDFGKDMAEELRDLMSTLNTHEAIDKDDIEDDLDRFDMKMDELNCIRTRQLGAQMNAQVALCADYQEQGEQVSLSNIQFVDMASSQVFEVDPITVGKDDDEIAAQQVFDAFDAYVQQVRFRAFCFDYANSSQWDNALRNCNDALELNPTDEGVLYQKAYVLWKQEDMEGAMTELETLLAQNPYHEEGLQLAGFLSSSLGDTQTGLDYYSRYLELNPGAVAVRRNIAYSLATEADNPEAALLLIEEGLTPGEEPNIDLTSDVGNYAFETARRQMPEGAQAGGEVEITPETRALFQKARDAYMEVFEVRGDSMSVSSLRNVISSDIQLGDLEEATATAEEVLEIFPEESSLWAIYSTALERQGRTDEAVAALGEIEAIDPEYPDLYARQGNLLLQAGRRDDALPLLQQAVDVQGADPNRISRIIFADAYGKGIQPDTKNWPYALEGITAAKQYDVSPETQQELDFWHGWVLYQTGIQVQEAQTLQSAEQAAPMFRQAKQLFEASADYARQREINLQQILEASDTYIEIQEAIIQRGR